jgi:hypothetical protein
MAITTTRTPHLAHRTLQHQVLGVLGVGLDSDEAAAVVAHRKLQDLGGVVLPDRLLVRIEALSWGAIETRVVGSCSTQCL